MTRKDYVKFAEVIRLNHWEPAGLATVQARNEAVKKLMVDIADIFAADNPRFDRQRFYAACEPRKGR